MTLHISAEIEKLARLVATKTGKSPDDIVKEAIEARALAAGVAIATSHRKYDEAKVRAIIARVSKLPILDGRSADDIIGYDEFGVPK
jgi:antitoxin VapB